MVKSNVLLGRMTAAMVAASLGITSMKIALPTLAGVLGLSTAAIGLVTGATAFAWPAFGLVAGWGLDRFGRVVVYRLGLAFPAIAAVALAVHFDLDNPGVMFLCLFSLFIGLGEVLTETAGQTILPDLVEKIDLPMGNSWLQGGKTVAAELLAPLLLATLLDFQPSRTFGFAVALMLIGLVLLPRPVRQVNNEGTGFKEFFGGVRLLARERTHRGFTLLLTAMSVSWGAWMTLIVPYTLTSNYLGLEATGVGQVMTALGCGALIGAMGYRHITQIFGDRGTLALDPLATTGFLATPALGLGIFPVFASALLAGIGGVTWAISVSAYQQSTIPPALLGRTVAAYRWIGWTGFFLGSTLGGGLADILGLRVAFLLFMLPAATALIIYCMTSSLRTAARKMVDLTRFGGHLTL